MLRPPHSKTETLVVQYNAPTNDRRINQPLFKKTRLALLKRDKQCAICGTDKKLQAHHHPIEWSLTEYVDWELVKRDFPAFDWKGFSIDFPWTFIDNMLVNGVLLCEAHHIGKNTGIHYVPFPLLIIKRYCKAGIDFSNVEVIHHA